MNNNKTLKITGFLRKSAIGTMLHFKDLSNACDNLDITNGRANNFEKASIGTRFLMVLN